ncbi:acyl-CoA dehydrogenase [Lapillicoccus jejuensis]|uniref:acyl-CoA oxidase n=1 Tax=Lapillicoccus jejuensis TaxID=402171 RepID=A0A542E561_9MICO|nr:acyl-CoA dehydrogenase [Lapillicoccus jejuensis]TQJ10483.1 acyl-coenzyme A oxidase [Lapillicoccus jejuensis]
MSELATALTAALGGRWSHVRDSLRAQDPALFAPPAGEPTTEEYRAHTTAQLALLAEQPYARDGVLPSQGGTGDLGANVTAFEMLGHGDLSLWVKAGVHFGLYGGAVTNLGLPRHQRWVDAMLDLSVPGCFAMTETGHGSNVQQLGTTATYDAATDELVVHTPSVTARKDYIGNAARDARMAAVFAQLVTDEGEHGVHCVLVPIRDARGRVRRGVTIGDDGPKAGLRGVDNGRLTFDHVRVPRENLLGRYGDLDDRGRYTSPIDNPNRRFFTMLGTLVRGRISVAAGAGAATRSALAIATRYAEHRRQFGAPGSEREVAVLDYRVHQRKLLPAVATSYALAFAQNELVELMHEVQTSTTPVPEQQQRELEARAAAIKVASTSHATAAIQTAREACGGAGYLSVNRLVDLKADTDVFTTFEGDNTVLLQLVGKGLLTEFGEGFQELGTLGRLRFGAGVVTEALLERTSTKSLVRRLIAAAPSRDTDAAGGSGLGRGRQLELFADRERHLLEGVARRLQRALRADDQFAVFNDAQDHLVAAARAHVDRVVLEAFAAGVEACTDPAARALLGTVCDLYALSTIEANRGWYLEHERLTPVHSKQVVAAVNVLCGQLRPHARDLVDGFGIPDAWLGTELLEPLEETVDREPTADPAAVA